MDGKKEDWHVGDKCMAPFSGDALYYRSSIKYMTKNKEGQLMASVRFSGFTEEEDEIIDVRHLKKRQVRPHRDRAGTCSDFSSGSAASASTSTADTSPLKYVNEEERLRAKYSDWLDESDVTNTPTSSRRIDHTPSSTTSSASSGFLARKKRKIPVAVGGQVKENNDAVYPARHITTTPSHVSPELPVRLPSENDSFDLLDSGFSSEEMEKPYFPGVANASAKVPLVLSQDGPNSVIQVPATINRYLRDYQREGVKFLYRHYQKGEGAILGDDMGLGKTVQVLAFLCAVLRKTGTKEDCQRSLPEFLKKKTGTNSSKSSDVFLIICPTSVMYNWLDEFNTWTYCTVGKYHGRERQETLWKAMKGKLDAVVTSYETYRIYINSLLKVKWAGVIVDEVHKIKEPGSLITQALKEINTKHRYGLTGTVLQNKLSELWCVLDWANPNCLGSLPDFKNHYEEAISKGQKFHASKRELAESRKVSNEFAKMRDGWMIRRTKALISDQLPTKDEKVVFCKLTELQLSIYKVLLESDDMQLVLKQKEICDCGSQLTRVKCCYKYNSEGEKVKALTMSFMSLLIKVANHVALLMPDVKMSDKQRKKARKYCDIAFARHPQFVALSRAARFCTLSDPSYCGKMQILEKLLCVFKQEGCKVLLFSYYTQLLGIIEMYLKTTDYVYRRLDGKTPAQDRQKYVHEFNTDPDIFLFLISTKAGGLGLNLTGANVVVVFDPNWNPSYDLQAQDRAYRIGQHRDVRVYRLISTGSIEENMYLRQIYKQQLASAAVTTDNPIRYFTAVAGDKKQQGELFGLHNMFALRADTSCLTKDLIQRHAKTEQGITMSKYIAPSLTTQQSEKASNLDDSTTDDGDSDSSDVGPASSMHEDNENDDHGVASQLTSESELSADEDDKYQPGLSTAGPSRTKTKKIAIVDATSCSRQKEQPVKGKSVSTAIVNRRKLVQETSESSSDEDKSRKHGVKGHAGNRGRFATKGQCVKGQTKRPKVTTTKQDGDRSEGAIGIATDGSRKSATTVDNIFKECGVSFIHSNMKIIGGSRVEDHVSNIAMRDVYELGLNSQQPANYNVPMLFESFPESFEDEASSSSPQKEPLHHSLIAQSQQSTHKMSGRTLLYGQTPRGIRRHHFEAMAKTLKHPSTSDFAKHILSLPQEQYAALLQEYYTNKHPQLDLTKIYQPPPSDNFEDTTTEKRPEQRTKSADVKCSKRKLNSRTRENNGKRYQSTGELKQGDDEMEENVTNKIRKSIRKDEIEKQRKKRGIATSSRTEVERNKPMRSSTKSRSEVQNKNSSENQFSDGCWSTKTTEKSCEHCKTQGLSDCACDGKVSESTGSSIAVQQENLSFLDDIFLTDRSKKSPKLPPRKKSTWTKPKEDFSDSDVEMEDLEDVMTRPIRQFEGKSKLDKLEADSTLWKRNSKFTSRQSRLEQVNTEVKLEERSVFEKYAESFVENKRFEKKDLHAKCVVYAEETPEVEFTEPECQNSQLCLAETF